MGHEIDVPYDHIDKFLQNHPQEAGTVDLAAEQEKYDAMYSALDKDMLEVCHEPSLISALGMDKWPRKSMSPILVAGAGTCGGIRLLDQMGFEAWGCDISRKCAEFAPNRDKFEVCALHDTPFEDNQFEMTIACDVLEHVPEEYVDATLKELFRITKNCWIFVVSVVESIGIEGMHLTVKPEWWWEKRIARYGQVYGTTQGEKGCNCGFMVNLYDEPRED
jgi:ubiquinone/menaquinone biosynthesis C-methylase UbiE